MKEYINNAVKKYGIWYCILLLLSTICVFKIGVFNIKINIVSVESVIFAVWILLLLFPLVSELEFLGMKVKREVQKETTEIKDEMRQQITILQNQILQVSSNSYVSNNIKIQNNSLPSEEQIQETMDSVKQLKEKNTSGINRHRTNYYDPNDIKVKIEEDYIEMLKVRYSLENKLRLKAEEMNYSLPKTKSAIDIIEILKKDEKIEELLYDLIVQVVQITNRVVHGQDVDDQYIGFVKKIYPDMVNMINKIGRNLKSEGDKNKILRSQGH